jgi:hypothetical protein
VGTGEEIIRPLRAYLWIKFNYGLAVFKSIKKRTKAQVHSYLIVNLHERSRINCIS